MNKRKPREKRETIIQTRQDGKRSAHIQGRYNEATIQAHSDILDMLADLHDKQKLSKQAILDSALRLLYSHLTNGGQVGEKLQNQAITGDLIALVSQALSIQSQALSILDKLESGSFALGDISGERGGLLAKGSALTKAGESLGVMTLPNAGQYAGEIDFSDEE